MIFCLVSVQADLLGLLKNKRMLAQRFLIDQVCRIMQSEQQKKQEIQEELQLRKGIAKDLEGKLPPGMNLGSVFTLPRSCPLDSAFSTEKIAKAAAIRRTI